MKLAIHIIQIIDGSLDSHKHISAEKKLMYIFHQNDLLSNAFSQQISHIIDTKRIYAAVFQRIKNSTKFINVKS